MISATAKDIEFIERFGEVLASMTKRNGLILGCYNSDEQLLRYVKRLLYGLGIEATGPHLQEEKGTSFFNKEKGKIYIRKKSTYYLYIRGAISAEVLPARKWLKRRRRPALPTFLSSSICFTLIYKVFY